MPNLMEGLLQELNRNRELLQQYKNIGPAGMIGASMIALDIQAGEKSISDDDIVAMVTIYQRLKGNK